MTRRMLFVSGLLLLSAGGLDAADTLKLVDGDRVVLLGNTLIERAQRYGYWETELTRLNPDKNIVFRNLGWSGDTVFGEARAGFGSVADGFKQLKDHVLANKPTVIIVGYGLNESFKGEAGLPEFSRGLGTLLDTLSVTRARIVLVSPVRQEDMGRPLPDPTEQNKKLELYRNEMRKVAKTRGHAFIDLFESLGHGKGKQDARLTDNGIHLSAYGYWKSAPVIAAGLGLKPVPWKIDFDKNGKITAEGMRVWKSDVLGVAFLAIDSALPCPNLPSISSVGKASREGARLIRIAGLPAGKHVLKIDRKAVIAATAEQWTAGVVFTTGPDFEQVEKLRQAIVAKNRLYFYRWRPQNETYLFGFRKHEQGKNGAEVVQFDPLIAKSEAEIARLRVPVSHRYEVMPLVEKDK